jgi:hypothetical protein
MRLARGPSTASSASPRALAAGAIFSNPLRPRALYQWLARFQGHTAGGQHIFVCHALLLRRRIHVSAPLSGTGDEIFRNASPLDRGIVVCALPTLCNDMRAVIAAALLGQACAWVLPGTAPQQFEQGATVRRGAADRARGRAPPRPAVERCCAPPSPREVPASRSLPPAQVELKVNKLTSPKTHLGYENYKLKFCRVRRRGGPRVRAPAPDLSLYVAADRPSLPAPARSQRRA